MNTVTRLSNKYRKLHKRRIKNTSGDGILQPIPSFGLELKKQLFISGTVLFLGIASHFYFGISRQNQELLFEKAALIHAIDSRKNTQIIPAQKLETELEVLQTRLDVLGVLEREHNAVIQKLNDDIKRK